MDTSERKRLIDKYREGPAEVDRALAGISEDALDFRIAEGEWTPREVVHHLADSEMTSAIRIRRLIAEDQPLIVGYDQEEFARRLYYQRPIEGSLAAFAGAHLRPRIFWRNSRRAIGTGSAPTANSPAHSP